MKTDTKDELRLANALLTEHIVNLQDRITSLESHNRELLAVIAAKDEALESMVGWVSKKIRRSIADQAHAIKPGDIALVEVGDFEVREDKQGTRYPRSSMSIGYDEFTVGVNHRLFVLHKKEGK